MAKTVKTYETILLDSDSGICRVVLNRPDKLHALNEQMCHDPLDAFSMVGKDDSARAWPMILSLRLKCGP